MADSVEITQAQSGAARSDLEVIDVFLEGGPVDFPDALRRKRTTPDEYKIKVLYGHGHEHFERTEDRRDVEGTSAVVYRWTMRTRCAE